MPFVLHHGQGCIDGGGRYKILNPSDMKFPETGSFVITCKFHPGYAVAKGRLWSCPVCSFNL